MGRKTLVLTGHLLRVVTHSRSGGSYSEQRAIAFSQPSKKRHRPVGATRGTRTITGKAVDVAYVILRSGFVPRCAR